MKKLLILFSLTLTLLQGYGQAGCDFFDDYSVPAAWTNVYIYPGIAPCSLQPQTGTLNVSGGTVNFTDVNDGNDTRVWRDLGFSLNDNAWTANFEFTPTSIGTDEPRVGHVIFALSDGNNCPFNDSIYHCDISDEDAITVWYLSEYYPVPSTTGFYIYAKNGTSWVSSWGLDWITADVGQTYYMTLIRVDYNHVTLEAYNDPARTDLVGTIDCFEIPDNITNLHVLQHGNAPWGFYTRTLTGTLDNTCIFNNIAESGFIVGPDTICEGEPADYSVSSGSGTMTWTLPGAVSYTVTGSNTIEVTDWGGLTSAIISVSIETACSSDTLSYPVVILPAVSVTDSISICANDTIYLFGVPVFASGTYSHTFTTAAGCDSIYNVVVTAVDTLETNETITICADDTIYIDGIAVSDDGTFSQFFISAGGCDSLHTIYVVTVDTVFANDTISICEGESAIINGNEEFSPGLYTENLLTVNGCDSVHNTLLIVNTPVDVFFVSDTVTCDESGIVLNPDISGSISEIQWTPASGLSCYDCLNPDALPEASGWYYLTVTDSNGCTDMDSIYISVDYSGLIFAPNAFSPNGDGVNDIFSIIAAPDCSLIYLRIYNRWGEMIFETNDINIGWDGTYKNIDQEIGTYVYIAEGLCSNGDNFLKGTITLVR